MFEVKKITNECIEWIREFFNENGPDCNAIVGISGGKDSSTVAALCVEALGKDRVIGVLMPCGEQADIDCSERLVEHLGIKSYTINIKSAVDSVVKSMPKDFDLTAQTLTNLPARIRMTTLYAVAQSNNGRVSNNCNLSEDWVGYSTLFGDAAGDFSPLSHLTVTEVKQIAKFLKIPDDLVEKPPIDGLSGKTDEENLGFSYAVLDRYIREGKIDNPETKKLIDERHKRNLFKLKPMPSYNPNV